MGDRKITAAQLLSLSFIAGRKNSSSTEICIELKGVSAPQIALEIWGQRVKGSQVIGYIVFHRHEIEVAEDGMAVGTYILNDVEGVSSAVINDETPPIYTIEALMESSRIHERSLARAMASLIPDNSLRLCEKNQAS